jgi:hypothetical protein
MPMRDTAGKDRDNFDIVNVNKLALSGINVEDDEIEEYDRVDEIYGAHHVSLRGKSANCDIDEVIDTFEKEGYEIKIFKDGGIYRDNPWTTLIKHIG